MLAKVRTAACVRTLTSSQDTIVGKFRTTAACMFGHTVTHTFELVSVNRVNSRQAGTVSKATAMEKITIGDIPAYVIGEKTDPGVIVIQVWQMLSVLHAVQFRAVHCTFSFLAGMVGRF